MAARLTITIDDADVSVSLSKARYIALELQPIMDRIGVALASSTRERFGTNVAPDGTPWLRSRAAVARGTPTLVKEGHLRDSIVHRADDDMVEVGSAMSYAGVHQAGFNGAVKVPAHMRRFTQVFGRAMVGEAQVRAHSRRMTLPARPFLGLSADDRANLIDIVEDAYAAAWGGS